MRNPLLQAVLTVALFWWAVCTGIYLFTGRTALAPSPPSPEEQKQIVAPEKKAPVDPLEVLANAPTAEEEKLQAVQRRQQVDAKETACKAGADKAPDGSLCEEAYSSTFVHRGTAGLFGILWGVLLIAFVILTKRTLVKTSLIGSGYRGLQITLGGFPNPTTHPKREPLKKDESVTADEVLNRWVQINATDSPAHVALFIALTEIYRAYPQTPAAKSGLGHGGHNLFAHTINVTRKMLEAAPDFEFKGMTTRDEKRVLIPILDANFAFDPRDPLLCLAAYAHDLGKIECYVAGPETTVVLNPNHDSVGALMLTRLPEFWGLPVTDQKALVLAVNFYHKKFQMPLQAGDRTRAIVDLLRVCDKEVSRSEGFSPEYLDYEIPDSEDEASALTTAANRRKPNEAQKELLAKFWNIIEQPGRINGRDYDRRVGFKYKDCVYVSEYRIRHLLAASMGQPELAKESNARSTNNLTIQLLRALFRSNALYHVHDGLVYRPLNAMFIIEFTDAANGRLMTRFECGMILHASASVYLKNTDDCRNPPTKVQPRFGERMAVNKALRDKQNQAAAAASEIEHALQRVSSEDGTQDLVEPDPKDIPNYAEWDTVIEQQESQRTEAKERERLGIKPATPEQAPVAPPAPPPAAESIPERTVIPTLDTKGQLADDVKVNASALDLMGQFGPLPAADETPPPVAAVAAPLPPATGETPTPAAAPITTVSTSEGESAPAAVAPQDVDTAPQAEVAPAQPIPAAEHQLVETPPATAVAPTTAMDALAQLEIKSKDDLIPHVARTIDEVEYHFFRVSTLREHIPEFDWDSVATQLLEEPHSTWLVRQGKQGLAIGMRGT